MGRSSGLGNMIGSVTDGKPLRGSGGSGIPMPIMPTENIGMISGAIRKKGGGRREERGSRPNVQLGRVTQPDGSTLITYGPSEGRGMGQSPRRRPSKEEFDKIARDPTKYGIPVLRRIPEGELSRPTVSPPLDRKPPDVGPFPDPTLGGPPEREVPIPKERPIRIEDGQKNFFETMFERAENKKQMRDIEKGERRDRQESMREEARMRDSERGGGGKMRDDDRGGRRKKEDRGGRRMKDDDRGGRNKRRRRRRDFTRKKSRMEGRRSREERGAFRDRYVSTLKK